MKKNSGSDRLSITEGILIIAILICYFGSLYFIISNNRSYLVVSFVLHSCLSIILILITRDKMAQQTLLQSDNSFSQFNEEKQIIDKYSEEVLALKKERDSLLADKELLSGKCLDAEKQIASLTEALKQEKESHTHEPDASALSNLLPENENPVNLNIIQCANAIIEEMSPYSTRSGIHLLLSCAYESLIVKADACFIRILFRNIIDNSIKYMRRNGSLVITISVIADDLFIVLKDNGEGLPSEETNRIFELNYQGSNRISGNGLGLTQAKAIVEYYGGTIYAKSEAGNGMGIYIQLPTNNQ